MCRVYFLELGGGFFYSAFPRNNNSLKIFFFPDHRATLPGEYADLEWSREQPQHTKRGDGIRLPLLAVLRLGGYLSYPAPSQAPVGMGEETGVSRVGETRLRRHCTQR